MKRQGFTEEQKKLCKQIANLLKKGNKMGLSFYGLQTELTAYLNSDLEMADLSLMGNDNGVELPYLDAGHLADSGADDYYLFEDWVPSDILDDDD